MIFFLSNKYLLVRIARSSSLTHQKDTINTLVRNDARVGTNEDLVVAGRWINIRNLQINILSTID
jgi:hypothetical protein